jgi:4-diphosphocytidyl-2-C-methyl-D-erythritol kinase
MRVHLITDRFIMIEKLLLASPAKLNLGLEILGKRPDGYHEIRTLFQKISLHDTLHFALRKERGVSVSADNPELPVGRRNLVYRAAAMLLERSNSSGGISIRIEKRIPIGAGLGGGSSNAAATLKALNEMLGIGLGRKELAGLGLEIGADVPFFLMEGAAIGTGIGERLKKVDLPPFWYLLINPGFEVSTQWAYRNLVLTKRRFRSNIHKFVRTPVETSRVLRNDLEEVVRASHPQINTMKEILYSAGAEGALMSGSGPTVFGIFEGEARASEAFRKIRGRVKKEGWLLFKAKGISA